MENLSLLHFLLHIPNKLENLPLIGTLHHFHLFIWTWVVMAIVLIIFAVGTHKRSIIPHTVQSILENLIEYFQNLSREIVGEEGPRYVPIVISIFLFVLVSNWLGVIPGVEPPTSSLNTTLALAIVSFLAFHLYGIRKRGFLHYILHYIDPIPTIWKEVPLWVAILLTIPLLPFFVLLNIIEELARILSLSVRLFGNVVGEHTLVITLSAMVMAGVYYVYPLTLFILVLGIVTGLVQAFIFSILTLTYISIAVKGH